MAVKVVLDHNLDWRLKRLLPGHEVVTVKDMGWEEAEAEFDVLLTGDKNLRHQQNLRGRSIALIVLLAHRNTYRTISPLMPQVLALLPTVQPGQV